MGVDERYAPEARNARVRVQAVAGATAACAAVAVLALGWIWPSPRYAGAISPSWRGAKDALEGVNDAPLAISLGSLATVVAAIALWGSIVAYVRRVAMRDDTDRLASDLARGSTAIWATLLTVAAAVRTTINGLDLSGLSGAVVELGGMLSSVADHLGVLAGLALAVGLGALSRLRFLPRPGDERLQASSLPGAAIGTGAGLVLVLGLVGAIAWSRDSGIVEGNPLHAGAWVHQLQLVVVVVVAAGLWWDAHRAARP